MSEDPSLHNENHTQPVRRLKLVMTTPPTQPLDVVGVKEKPHEQRRQGESSSPPRPSYSPVTPTLSHVPIAGHSDVLTDEPLSLPVSLEENSDAIALRATISLLQMQRQQSLRDIKRLDKIKRDALQNPQSFVDDLLGGKMTRPDPRGITFDDDNDADAEDSSGRADEHEVAVGGRRSPFNGKVSSATTSKFGKLPTPQNITRCPPIEWSKYHVLGQPLDMLHESQRRNPGTSEDAVSRSHNNESYQIAAPYRPFVDKLDPQPKPEGYDI